MVTRPSGRPSGESERHAPCTRRYAHLPQSPAWRTPVSPPCVTPSGLKWPPAGVRGRWNDGKNGADAPADLQPFVRSPNLRGQRSEAAAGPWVRRARRQWGHGRAIRGPARRRKHRNAQWTKDPHSNPPAPPSSGPSCRPRPPLSSLSSRPPLSLLSLLSSPCTSLLSLSLSLSAPLSAPLLPHRLLLTSCPASRRTRGSGSRACRRRGP